MMRMTVLSLGALILMLGCSGDETVIRPTPEQSPVEDDAVPGQGEGIYYNFSVKPSDDPRPILEQILDSGIDLRAAWHPRYESLCMIMTAAAALVVQIDGQSTGMEELGFVADPEPLLPNCGVGHFWEYRPVD